jgi:hypothetical protein
VPRNLYSAAKRAWSEKPHLHAVVALAHLHGEDALQAIADDPEGTLEECDAIGEACIEMGYWPVVVITTQATALLQPGPNRRAVVIEYHENLFRSTAAAGVGAACETLGDEQYLWVPERVMRLILGMPPTDPSDDVDGLDDEEREDE